MVISVQCPSCSTSFPVDTKKVPEEGVHARCSVCSDVFFVERPLPAMAGAAAESSGGGSYEVASEAWRESVGAATTEEVEVAEATPVEEEATPGGFEFVESEPAVAEAPPEPVQPSAPAAHPAEPAPARVEPQPAPPSAFTFGRRDPHEKARRLARVLVSDMIMYNPDRHTRAIAAGSLREDFEDEIKKSWQEYVEQVGQEIAKSTPYFDDALNDILARGQKIFP
jgi:predicted Zn finger-like uncharacterized protein